MSRTPQAIAPAPRTVIAAALLDATLVVIFAALGRSSHSRDATALGLLETAWPFLAGLAIMWLIVRAWRAPGDVIRTGVPIWSGTVLFGMLLRALTGAGTAFSFVLVTITVLCLFLVGWRLISTLIRRRRA
ncbi:DUF3054 domain-containing protein [Leucobacter sp. cx-328]|uniref:DUF3054 domain-containing protein n=1 Tax=unclassified Leucobacter TaxID=2621730 RepID=UPI00165E5FCC|nr:MULTISPECIES: DUF3054 domain-containing protein [unclassified Leucobacter]MBC9944201.1 DUF3054 domain-containing protein [Leucobacter sp. cx-328]